MSDLKLKMFEEINTSKATQILDARTLGFSQIRLLPKGNNVRAITNLRRRITKLQNGKATLGRSINSVMAPVFNILDFEKRKEPAHVGSALFSVGDMYPKLKAFAVKLREGYMARDQLYFVKADAKSCFDTIPQKKVIRLMERMITEDEYRIMRHAELKISDSHNGRNANAKPARRFIATARACTDFASFSKVLDDGIACDRKNTVFVDGFVDTSQKRRKTLDLLKEHVEGNIIKIGKKFFRQKAGIPQGSVLSSLLCNYFYAQLEREHLDFLKDQESILMRLIDDFLLITTNKEHAKQFLQIMHDGIPEYGVEVNPGKSLANFEITVNGLDIPKVAEGEPFPYCGNAIHLRTLEISKDTGRRLGTGEEVRPTRGKTATNKLQSSPTH